MLPVSLAFVVMLVGLLMFVLATGPKAPEIGRIMFAAGLVVLLWTAGSVAIRLGWV